MLEWHIANTKTLFSKNVLMWHETSFPEGKGNIYITETFFKKSLYDIRNSRHYCVTVYIFYFNSFVQFFFFSEMLMKQKFYYIPLINKSHV